MNDSVMMARSAREQLARGLGALQAPGVPPQLLDVAEPIAQAMSALHRIEASQGASAAEAAPGALEAVRRALSGLQSLGGGHATVGPAIEAVAGSLNLIHQLATRSARPPEPQLAFAGTMVADVAQAAVSRAPTTQPSQPQHAVPAPQGFPAHQPYAQPAPQQAYAAPQPQAYPQQPAPHHPHQAPAQPAYAAQPVYAAPPQPAPAAQGGAPGMIRVDAEMGAHSPTNFYKGLSGNDVVDAGGIFIATYQIPKIGTPVLIHVTMPGGYEFEARGIVRWTREAPASTTGGAAHAAPPGYGAQFTEITPEGRQLVYRYVRNREPLFHDDF